MLSRKEVSTIKNLLRQGYSIPYIVKVTGRSATTIYKLKSNDGKTKSRTNSEFDFHISHIKKRRNQGVTNISKLHKELQKRGYSGSYHKIYRYIKDTLLPRDKYARIPKRRESGPGEEAQVDWGSFGKIIVNGIVRRLYAFVYILSYSRMKYVEFTTRQDLQTLIMCLLHAFQKLQIPQSILYDNMKTVVLHRDRKDNLKPTFNPTFLDFANHHGFQIKLSYPYWPRDKGKVEAAIKLVRNNFMNGMKFGRDFQSIDELNEKVSQWLVDIHNTSHHTTREKPIERIKHEKNFLRPLNSVPQYNPTTYFIRHSTQYGTIQHKSNFYDVTQKFARKKLYTRERSVNGEIYIDIYFQDKLIKSYSLAEGRGKLIEDRTEHAKKDKKKISSSAKRQTARKRKRTLKSSFLDFTRSVSYYEQLLK